MKVVIQRVIQASVTIQQQLHASIGRGMMILVGIQADDHEEDIEWLSSKICNLRIFDDENGLMARTKKGNRPSYIDAAKPEISVPLYEKFVQSLQKELQKEIKTGVFGADMQVGLINDGPVTIIIDSKNRL